MNYEKLLIETALADERYIVMTAENRALCRNMQQSIGDRFIDTGITEQTLVGASAGLALRGRIPIIHALAAFLTMRAFEFIRTDVALANLPVKLSGFIPGFLSDANGPTHQAIEDIALMRGIPNMSVYAPADQDDLLKMLPLIWSAPGPSYVRINIRPSTYVHTPFQHGKAEVISTGEDLTFITYGLMLEQTLIAAAILKDAGKSIGVINIRCLQPVDEEAIMEAVTKSDLLITVEDHFITGGLYSIIADILLQRQMTAKVIPFALRSKWFKPGLLPEVWEHEGFTGQQIAEKVGKIIALQN